MISWLRTWRHGGEGAACAQSSRTPNDRDADGRQDEAVGTITPSLQIGVSLCAPPAVSAGRVSPEVLAHVDKGGVEWERRHGRCQAMPSHGEDSGRIGVRAKKSLPRVLLALY